MMVQIKRKSPILLLTLGIFALMSIHLHASEMVVEPEISEVKVYISGAEVFRTFKVEVPQGRSQIVVQGLPSQVSDYETYTSQRGTDIRVVDTSTETRYTTEPFSDAIVEIDKKIDALNQKISLHEDELKSIELELDFIQQLVEHYPTHNIHQSTDVANSVDIADEVLNLVRNRSKSALDAKRATSLDIGNAKTELSSLEKERNTMGGKQLQSTDLSIGIVATQAGETEFVVSYFVRQSSWRPSYSAYLDSGTDKVTIFHDAVVYQRSPEPWTDVKLTLTTANPRRDADPPELFSHFVDKLERPSAVAVEEHARSLVVTGSRIRRDREDQGINAAYDVETTSFDYTTVFVPNEHQSVNNDNSEHGIVGLGYYEFDEVEVTTTVIPRHDDLGYLSAQFTFEGQFPLPGGGMRCFVDGSYVGRVYVSAIQPNEEVSLPLGRDDMIEVTLENQGGSKGREGFFRNRKVEETHFLVTIQNHRSTPSNIEVLDYYPVSRHEDVQVEIHDDATPPDKENVDDRPGRLAWVKSVGPNETWKITQRYSVSYPRDSDISTSYNR